MTQLLTFAIGAAVLLTLLGIVATPRSQRLPLRRWTPVHVADLIGRGASVFTAAGKERVRRVEAARQEAEGLDPGRPRPRRDREAPDGREDTDERPPTA